MTCELLSYRVYGKPKIHKPNILRGLNPKWKFKCLEKPANVYGLEGDTFVIYFGALFCKLMSFQSPEDISLPTSALAAKYPERLGNRSFGMKFIYPDAWCTVYERNEGYVSVIGLVERLTPPRNLLADRGQSYPPLVINELMEKFTSLSFKDNGFANCCGMIYSEYERFFSDFVWKVFQEYIK